MPSRCQKAATQSHRAVILLTQQQLVRKATIAHLALLHLFHAQLATSGITPMVTMLTAAVSAPPAHTVQQREPTRQPSALRATSALRAPGRHSLVQEAPTTMLKDSMTRAAAKIARQASTARSWARSRQMRSAISVMPDTTVSRAPADLSPQMK